MKAPRKPLWIIERPHTIIVKGNAKMILQAGGFKPIYVGTVRGFLLDRERLPDILAYLESRHIAYEVTSLDDAA
jgi:hypothetical protein